MTNWNYADVWERVADAQPTATAVVQGAQRTTWAELDRHADGIGRWLLELGVAHQDKLAIYLHNSRQYLESTFGAAKVGVVPVNTNYRYADDELAYLWDNADAVAVVFHGVFAERVERVRKRVAGVRSWLWVDDGSGPCPPWSTPYDEAIARGGGRVTAPWGRSGDDLFMLYTGGTTGMPKGVMWRQDDLFARLNRGGFRHYDPAVGIEDVTAQLRESGPGRCVLVACPLMHGTGQFASNESLAEGGKLVLLESRRFDPVDLLDSAVREQANVLVIVGDPFARPMLVELDARPGHWDLSSVLGMISSGAMWSEEVKRGLLAHHPGMLLVDAFSSSEALGMGSSVSSADSPSPTAQFTLGEEVKVIDNEGHPVEAGSDDVGMLALGGRNPLGYYKDEAKTSATFKVMDGVRYSVPGDFAQVRADGTIHLLGRGSVCINSAGEKVFPEEVEEALKTHPRVRDAVVVGVPHEQYGEQVVAVVELERQHGATSNRDPSPDDSSSGLDERELIAHVRQRLAAYKAPRRVRVVDTIGRSPNGKVDYERHRLGAVDWMATLAG